MFSKIANEKKARISNLLLFCLYCVCIFSNRKHSKKVKEREGIKDHK